MAIESGFFNSINKDRLYNADHVDRFFEGILLDGILSTVGDALVVTVTSGMGVKVGSGRGWFNYSYLYNDSDHVLTIEPSHASLPRQDIIVLDFDRSQEVRTNTIKVLKGTPASTPVLPTLVNTDEHKQYPLCYIYVTAGVSSLNVGDLTDKRGSSLCPYSTGLLQQAHLDAIYAGWEYDFMVWFNSLVDVLDGDAATNLANEIDEIRAHMPGRNILVNGDMTVAQRINLPTQDAGNVDTFDGFHTKAPDMWRFVTQGNATWTPLQYGRNEYVGGNSELADAWYLAAVETPGGAVIPNDSKTYLEQYLPIDAVWNKIKKGPVSPDKLTLSFTFRSPVVGNFVVEIIDKQNDRHFCALYSNPSSNVEQRVAIPIPEDTIGPELRPYAPQGGLVVRFWLTAGSNYTSGTLPTSWSTIIDANSAVGQVNVGAFYDVTKPLNYILTNVQLEVGDIASEFEVLEYDDRVNRCKGYFEYVSGFTLMTATENGYARFMGQWDITKKESANLVEVTANSKYTDDIGNVTYANVAPYLSYTVPLDMVAMSNVNRSVVIAVTDASIVSGETYLISYKMGVEAIY